METEKPFLSDRRRLSWTPSLRKAVSVDRHSSILLPTGSDASQQKFSASVHSFSTSNSVGDSITTSTIASETASTDKVKPVVNDFEIEIGHGISEEDKLLSRRDKNAVDFAFNYSKLWCKSCKDLVMSLEKRSFAETECNRIIAKQFQTLEAGVNSVNGAPMKQEVIQLSRMMIEQCKESDLHNAKRCRELLEVMTRQRTLFEKTRKFLKDKWKADMKRMIDAENSLFKTKTAYYQRCQTGVKLREELVLAQALLNELNVAAASCLLNVNTSAGGASSGASVSGASATGPTASNGASVPSSGFTSTVCSTAGSSANLAGGDGDQSTLASTADSSMTTAASAQIAKQRVKVERLEKQLSDNDKKEFELMYAYRESVETANHRLYDLERSKAEILCDTRLTIAKSDEVVKDSLAELFNHLYTTRTTMLKQYEAMAATFQDYTPCSDYRSLVVGHVQKGVDTVPEKYHFDGFHESAAAVAASAKIKHAALRSE